MVAVQDNRRPNLENFEKMSKNRRKNVTIIFFGLRSILRRDTCF